METDTTKLGLRHLSRYLPHQVEILTFDDDMRVVVTKIKTLAFYKDDAVVETSDGWDLDWHEFQLILKPLSDMKPSQFNELRKISAYFEIGPNRIWFSGAVDLSVILAVQDYLLSNHFDVFGLIEARLAIDINTLN